MVKEAIVCIDNEEIAICSLEKQLKRVIGRNYIIELAFSETQALNICAKLKKKGIEIALIISARLIIDISGDELLVKLHTLYPKIIKILLIDREDTDYVANLINSTALFRYLIKPWNETDLILTVKEALRRYGREKKLIEQNIILQKIKEELANSLDILLAKFEPTDDGILVLDDRGRVVTYNQQLSTILELDNREIKRDINYILEVIKKGLLEPFAWELITKETEAQSEKSNLLKLPNNRVIEYYLQIQRIQARIVGSVWGFRDVTGDLSSTLKVPTHVLTNREGEKATVKERVSGDTSTAGETFFNRVDTISVLTQLPKDNVLKDRVWEAIVNAKNNSHLLAVVFVDLDRFKMINDSLGHQIGDRLLQEVVTRLKTCIREKDLITHWGNDRFTLLLPKINHKQDTNTIARRILKVLKSAFQIEDRSIYIAGNVGIAIYPEHGEDAETLIKNAEIALSQSQQDSNNNYRYYNPDLYSQNRHLLSLEERLHLALEKEEFLLYYQPIVNLNTGRIVKMEALLRWQNERLGSVSPYIFIPLAEENGDIIPIGEWVLQTACAQNKSWQNMGLPPIKISVNLSVRQFQRADLVFAIADTLELARLHPSYLELEITEKVTMQDTESVREIMRQLKEKQISISMDDFGTGYSSFGYLKQLPFETIKIDRSLVKNSERSSSDLAMIKSIATLGKGLNLKIVAEGVETLEVQNLLKNLGCEYIQGYLFSKPLPAEEATILLQENSFITAYR